MKIVEVLGRPSVIINNEEAELLERFDGSEPKRKHELNERDQVIANQLVNKDLLTRLNNEGTIIYKRRTG